MNDSGFSYDSFVIEILILSIIPLQPGTVEFCEVKDINTITYNIITFILTVIKSLVFNFYRTIKSYNHNIFCYMISMIVIRLKKKCLQFASPVKNLGFILN